MDSDAQPTRRIKVGRLIGWLGLMVLAVSLFATISWASDLLKIGSLLANPESYKLRIVQVEGIVSGYRMNHFIGRNSMLEKCTQYFMVEDDTGAMSAVYRTICPTGVVILSNGDRVTIEAHFEREPGGEGVLEVRSVTKN
jgi:hypothetical protein